MEGVLIFLGFIMLVGQIILFQMWNNSWFKKENFKLQRDTVKAENRLKLKKLEKEFGLKGKSVASEIKNESSIMDLLKNLDRDKITDILELLQGGETTEKEGIAGILEQIPPELIEGFLNGLKDKQNQEGEFKSQV